MSDLDDHDAIEKKPAPPGSATTEPQLPYPGVFAELGALPPGAFITAEGLATLLKRHPETIRRAVAHGDLPAPVRLFGVPTWTVGAIIRHHEKRMERAAEQKAETV